MYICDGPAVVCMCVSANKWCVVVHASGACGCEGLGVGGWDLRFGVRDWGWKQADDITQHLAARRAMAGPLMLAVAEEQGVV